MLNLKTDEMRRSTENKTRPVLLKAARTMAWSLCLLLLALADVQAQNLFTYSNQYPTLNQGQRHHVDVIREQMQTDEIYFVDVDNRTVRLNAFTVSDPYGKSAQFIAYKSEVLRTGSFSTFGRVGDEDVYRSHFFLRKNYMRGEFMVDGTVYVLKPIGDGMHVIYDRNHINVFK